VSGLRPKWHVRDGAMEAGLPTLVMYRPCGDWEGKSVVDHRFLFTI